MSHTVSEGTVVSRIIEITTAPLNSPEIIPAALPLVVGWIVIELYFGKHKDETLGWNTSVGNSILWVATGFNLLVTEAIETTAELYATGFLLASGIFVGYMDFFHKWSSQIAFRISSADTIYPLAYVTVVVVKTDMPVNETVLKAGLGFVVGSILVFRAIRMMETPAYETPFPR